MENSCSLAELNSARLEIDSHDQSATNQLVARWTFIRDNPYDADRRFFAPQHTLA